MAIGAKILMVDDDKDDHLIIDEYFREIGIGDDVHYLINGIEAIKYLGAIEDPGSLPKIIILDLNMPKMNGTQTLMEIKSTAHLKNIPVIIYSTSENETEKRKALSLGAVDYVVKPMTYDEGKKIVKRFAEFI